MKTSFARSIILAAAGIAITTLTSCVDPYYASNSRQPQRNSGYSAGYEVRNLPSGYRTEVIGGERYYNHNGTYYRSRSGRYVVVEAPRHENRYDRPRGSRERVIYQLPRGYRTVNHNGTRYYRVNDAYYERRGSSYVEVQISR